MTPLPLQYPETYTVGDDVTRAGEGVYSFKDGTHWPESLPSWNRHSHYTKWGTVEQVPTERNRCDA